METNNDSSRWVDERLDTLNSPAEWHPDSARALARLREQRGASSRRARRLAWLGAGTAAASVSLMAFPVTRAFAQRCAAACVSESTRVSQFLLTSFTGARVETNATRLAPDFLLSDASGREVRLSDFRGKVVLLNFWATWCLPCTVEIPWFTEFQQRYPDFVVLGVSMDEDGWSSVRPFIEKRKVNYRVMLGNEKVSALFGGVPALPATFIIDRSGKIVATHAGMCSRNDYETEIRAALEKH
jgi:peroxiredoxin